MQKEDLKFTDSTVFEGMTSIRAILRGIDAGVNDRQITKILFDKEKIRKISKELGYLKAVSEKYGYEIIESNSGELEQLTLGNSHGGLIAITEARTLPLLDSSSEIILYKALACACLRGVCYIVIVPKIVIPVSRNVCFCNAKIRSTLNIMSVLL